MRSRIAQQQKPQEERQLEVTDPSLTLCTISGKASGEAQEQGQTGGECISRVQDVKLCHVTLVVVEECYRESKLSVVNYIGRFNLVKQFT